MEIVLGFLLDLIIGDPHNPLHPVRIIGSFASFIEKINRKIFKNVLKLAGFITWIMVALVTYLVGYLIVYLTLKINFYLGFIVQAILIYFCISTKGLKVEGLKVLSYILKKDIQGARKQLSYIVGRDTNNLTESEILRAVIETIAENMSDGIIAPLLFIGIGGAPLGLLYKSVNTMDSMFGYKNDKYIDFGFFPAKLDDVFNFIPARVTGFLIIIASFLLGLDSKNSYKIYKRDKMNHSSPNSAHPEAAAAGALRIMLGGTNYYFGKPVVKPTIGDDLKTIEISTVFETNKLLYLTAFLGLILSIGINFIIYYSWRCF